MDTENQFSVDLLIFIGFTSFIESIGATNFTESTGSTRATRFISFIGDTSVIGFTENIETTIKFWVLDDITQQLLESKHTFTLGQLFKIAPNLKQYVGAKHSVNHCYNQTFG